MGLTKADAERCGIADLHPAGAPKATEPAEDAMNRTERRYADRLEALKLAGEVRAWWFEAVKLRLAGNTFYTPDFMVVFRDGTVEFHEVKGFWHDDARVKFKMAAELYPFPLMAVRWVKKTWEFERIEAKRR